MMYRSETWPVRAEDMCCMERSLHWLGHIERMDKSFWVNRYAEQLRCQVQLVDEGQRKYGKK